MSSACRCHFIEEEAELSGDDEEGDEDDDDDDDEDLEGFIAGEGDPTQAGSDGRWGGGPEPQTVPEPLPCLNLIL